MLGAFLGLVGKVWKAPVSSPPTLTSLNYTQCDVLGGGSNIVITGTLLTGVSAVELRLNGSSGAWTAAASLGANTSTTQAFQMPALAAGVYDLRVTTSGGQTTMTNAIESWAPNTEAGCTSFAEAPSYSATGSNGTWTMRVGATAWANATIAPAASTGGPAFAGTNALDGAADTTLFNGANGGAISFVASLSSAGAPNAAAPYNEKAMLSEAFGNTGCGYSTAGFRAYVNDNSWKNAVVACPADGTLHAMVGRFKTADFVQASVDGSAFASASTAVGTLILSGNGRLGMNFNNTSNMTGGMRAVVTHNIKPPDTYAGKFFKWSQQRHGVA